MSILYDLIRDYKKVDLTDFVRVKMDARNIGWTKRTLAMQLASLGDIWAFRDDALVIQANGLDFDSLTKKVDETFFETATRGWTPTKPEYPHGGDDWFGIGNNRGHDSLFIMRRFFTRFLGSQFDSVFINGFEKNNLWLAVRGAKVDHSVGKLDVMVAGARQYDQSQQDALFKEGSEEAGMTKAALPNIEHTGQIQLFYHGPFGFLKDEIFNIYDFDTRGAFKPTNPASWEVERFETMPFDALLDSLENSPEKFKPHIILVLIDFLMRHNVITRSYPNYDKIFSTLHERIDFNGENIRAFGT